MFKKILDFFRDKREEEDIKKNFLKNKDTRLPRYSPITGIELRWNIISDQKGPYDIYTGRPIGEITVWVLQEPPTHGELLRDNRHYKYSVLTGNLTTDEIFEWKFILNETWDELCSEEGKIQLRYKEDNK